MKKILLLLYPLCGIWYGGGGSREAQKTTQVCLSSTHTHSHTHKTPVDAKCASPQHTTSWVSHAAATASDTSAASSFDFLLVKFTD